MLLNILKSFNQQYLDSGAKGSYLDTLKKNIVFSITRNIRFNYNFEISISVFGELENIEESITRIGINDIDSLFKFCGKIQIIQDGETYVYEITKKSKITMFKVLDGKKTLQITNKARLKESIQSTNTILTAVLESESLR